MSTAAAVIGHLGVTGRSHAAMLAKGYDLVTYDVAGGVPYPAEIAGCEFAVVSVGTPAAADGSADLSAVRAAAGALPAGMPVLLRSTVPPGTTAGLAASRPGLVAHAPEFMQERPGGAWPASADVPFLILGGDAAARGFFGPRLEAVFPGVIRECDALTAELVKYTLNLYWAARVTFVNEMAGVAAAFGGDWEQVRAGWLADPRVSDAYTAMGGFPRGFGGRCWPKDLAALRAACRGRGHETVLLDAVAAANERFRDA